MQKYYTFSSWSHAALTDQKEDIYIVNPILYMLIGPLTLLH